MAVSGSGPIGNNYRVVICESNDYLLTYLLDVIVFGIKLSGLIMKYNVLNKLGKFGVKYF